MVNEAPRSTSTQRFFNFPLVVAILLFAATLLWLFRWRWTIGRKDEWSIHVNAAPWPGAAWWLPLGVFGLFIGLAFYFAYDRFYRAKTRRAQSISTGLTISALMALTLIGPWALLEPGGTANLINVTWSDVSNEYFATAYQIQDVRQFTRDYAAQRQRLTARTKAHVATHPPGATLFYYAARRVFESSSALQNVFTALTEKLTGGTVAAAAAEARRVRGIEAVAGGNAQSPFPLPDSAAPCALWCVFLLACAMAATVPAVYGLASLGGNATGEDDSLNEANAHQATNEMRGLMAATLFSLTPSVQFFAFTLDALIACGVAWTLFFLSRRLAGGSIGWLIAAGITLGLTCFVSFGVIAVLALLLFSIALHTLSTGSSAAVAIRATVRDFTFVLAGFLGVWVLLLLCFPMQIGTIFHNAMAAHYFATLEYRNRWAWLWLNLLTFALFAGWAFTVAVASRLSQFLHQWRAQGSGFLYAIKGWTPGEMIGWATLLTMLLLTLSGSVRGEVERLWLFLLPSLCVLASFAFVLPVSKGSVLQRGIKGWAIFLLLQALQTLLMAVALQPLSRPF